jgi:hypothetical protein
LPESQFVHSFQGKVLEKHGKALFFS